MNKDRIAGAAHVAKGTVKEKIGEIFGDDSLKIDGQAEKIAGKIQQSVGGAKDAIKDAAS
jgi:uncharacterized protein YjbJ (UPF0337 family)